MCLCTGFFNDDALAREIIRLHRIHCISNAKTISKMSKFSDRRTHRRRRIGHLALSRISESPAKLLGVAVVAIEFLSSPHDSDALNRVG